MPTRISCITKLCLIIIGIMIFPAFAKAIDFGNLMILGDSITQAQGNGTAATPLNGRNSYRYQLWKYLVDNNATFDLVGSHDINRGVNSFYPSYQGLSFDRDNEGHWAWDTDDVLNGSDASYDPTSGSGTLSDWLTGYTPDTAIILLGSNDISRGASGTTLVSSLGSVIDTLQADNPNVRIYLSTMIPRNGTAFDTEIPAANALFPDLATSKTTATSTVSVIDVYDGFSISDHTYDGIHPNSQGEYLVATKLAAGMGLDTNLPSTDPTKDRGALHVINGSFEYPVTTGTSTTITGWDIQEASDGSRGIFNVKKFHATDSLFYTPESIANLQDLDGTNATYILRGSTAIAYSQTLAGADGAVGSNDDPVLIADTRYSVSVAFGFRNGTYSYPWAGATVELLAGEQVVGSMFVAPDSPNVGIGDFIDYTFNFTTDANTVGLGEPLTVRIERENEGNAYIDFDNVRVYAADANALLTKDYGQMYIANHSFEKMQGVTSIGVIEGWDVDPSLTSAGVFSVMTHLPGGFYSDVTSVGDLDQEYACYMLRGATSPAGGIQQTLAGFDNVIGTEDDPVLVADAEYSLTVAVALRDGSRTDSDELSDWAGAVIELLAGDEVIASKIYDATDPLLGEMGEFTDVNLSFITDANTAGLGELMTIRISREIGGDPSYLDIDNVRLTVTSIPEPSTVALLLSALAGLGCFFRRR